MNKEQLWALLYGVSRGLEDGSIDGVLRSIEFPTEMYDTGQGYGRARFTGELNLDITLIMSPALERLLKEIRDG